MGLGPRRRQSAHHRTAGAQLNDGEPDFERNVTRATFWSLVEKWASRGIGLIALLVFGRLLNPDDFGALSIVGVYVALATVVVDLGLSRALIQARELDSDDLRSAFTVQVLSGSLLTLLALSLAVPIGRLMGQPDLGGLLAAASPTALLLGLGLAAEAKLMRGLSFRPLAIRRIVATAAGVAVGTVLAVYGYGAWAYIWMVLVQTASATVAVWVASDWRPSFGVSRAALNRLGRVSRHLLGIDAISFVGGNVDYVIVGLVLGTAALGFYTVGYRILQVVADLMSAGLAAVALPAFARIIHDEVRSKRAYLIAAQVSAATAVPVFAAMALFSSIIVRVVFGPNWGESAGVMSALAVASAFSAISYFDRSFLIALGRGRLEMWLNVFAVITEVIGILVAASYGIIWVAVAMSVVHFFGWPLRIWALRAAVGLDVRAYMRSVAPVLGATLGMVLILLPFVVTDSGTNIARGLAEILFAAIVYLVLLRFFSPSAWAKLRAIVGHLVTRNPTPSG